LIENKPDKAGLPSLGQGGGAGCGGELLLSLQLLLRVPLRRGDNVSLARAHFFFFSARRGTFARERAATRKLPYLGCGMSASLYSPTMTITLYTASTLLLPGFLLVS